MPVLEPLNLYRLNDPRAAVLGKAATNAGLAYFKFFGAKPTQAGGASESTGALLAAFMGKPSPVRGDKIAMVVGVRALITEHCGRLRALADCEFKLDQVSRMMTGLGLPHATDNGFAFHPILSVPPLAGSGLKQVAKAGAARLEGNDKDIERIFGTVGSGRGSVAFLDALPCTPVTLTLEQITNHYPGYYQGPNPADMTTRDDLELPADWYNPIPVSLLAVEASFAKPQCWQFGLKALRGAGVDDCTLAQEWLIAGLQHEGFGGKVDDGFGRFLTAEARAGRVAPNLDAYFPAVSGPPGNAAAPQAQRVNVRGFQVGAQVGHVDKDGRFVISQDLGGGRFRVRNAISGLEFEADREDLVSG